MIQFKHKFIISQHNQNYLNSLFKSKEFSFLSQRSKYCKDRVWSINEDYENYLCLKYPELLHKYEIVK